MAATLPDCMIPDGNNGACKSYLELEAELKLYKQALTKAVSLPKGKLPVTDQYYSCSINGNVNVFRRPNELVED